MALRYFSVQTIGLVILNVGHDILYVSFYYGNTRCSLEEIYVTCLFRFRLTFVIKLCYGTCLSEDRTIIQLSNRCPILTLKGQLQ